jgi:hypothetical protein
MFKNMLAVPKNERENSQWEFGHPVTLKDEPNPAKKQSGGPARLQVEVPNN